MDYRLAEIIMAGKKEADRIRSLYNLSDNWARKQWQRVNQKGYEFANDDQLSEDQKQDLESQGMPTFTINRISPVVEMLNYYATANNPRWQAIGVDGSDSAVAAVFSDLADYVWANSGGDALFSNAINDAITKSLGIMIVSVDQNQDHGMGEIVVQQPNPFDVFIDPKSRDLMFSDASFIMIRKVLPVSHLISLYPDQKRLIVSASTNEASTVSYTERALGTDDQKLFLQDDPTGEGMAVNSQGEQEPLIEFFEVYEKVKVSYINLFYRIPPNKAQLKQIKSQCQVMLKEMQGEMEVQFLEQQQQMQAALQGGQMLPERYELEINKAKQMMEQQLQAYEQECMSKLQAEASKVENKIITEKEFKILQKDPILQKHIVDAIQFYGTRVRQTCVAGDKKLYSKILPDTITEYPIVPFHFKWTGTPYPMSAVSPLVGKQTEINKSHQIMVHNASLGSSLRWMYEEGSIDADIWEKYSAAPGALLPVRPGSQAPSPVMPAPLSNAFFSIVQQGKHDMEYLAGIYSSMQGDTQQQHETFRGMLALDEYGTRRIKQWMNTCIEPGLKQLGTIIMQFSQSTYTAHKRFRIVQPSALQEVQEKEINIPIYNDMGKAIGKSMDLSVGKFDIRIISGSTLPINRWAYLEELKSLLQLGVVDDVAVLAETDLKNKEGIAERKSMMAQLQSQMQQLSEALKDKEGTIETLERQLVQAGIKSKVMQAEVEINKQKEQVKNVVKTQGIESEAKHKLLRGMMQGEANYGKRRITEAVDRTIGITENLENDLE